jgi:TolB protein
MPDLRHPLRAGLLAVALLCLATAAQAQLTVQITKGVTAPIPAAVVPFGASSGEAPPPLDVADVIQRDLERSGRFAGLPRASMLQRPTTGVGLDVAQWRLLKTDFVVIGRVVPEGARYAVQIELYNVVTGERLLGYSIPAAAGGLRLAAHRAADPV